MGRGGEEEEWAGEGGGGGADKSVGLEKDLS